ncbi:hypothetical protein M407DRAFT_29791 [Tulasnella calospora MUT 4182]|uniref:RING-type domain-containing protein n=1 Tax=Tulasnella calospora MUT 4182 TaxID=1051891 RepID=A0A0C3Q8G4_9AGAM|nr:hypothetical protein M407DRAFT_29791 [Tulasnella calospora MUT 4182]
MGVECHVCFDSLRIDSNPVALDCGHVCHLECLESWLDQAGSCPICRHAIPRNPRNGDEYFRRVYLRFSENDDGNDGGDDDSETPGAGPSRAADVLKAKAETIQAQITALTENPFGQPQAIRDLLSSIRSVEMTVAGLGDSECRILARHISQQLADFTAFARTQDSQSAQRLQIQRTENTKLRRTLERLEEEKYQLNTRLIQATDEISLLKEACSWAETETVRVRKSEEERRVREVKRIEETMERKCNTLQRENDDKTERITGLLEAEDIMKDTITRYKREHEQAKKLRAELDAGRSREELQAKQIQSLQAENKRLKAQSFTSQLGLSSTPVRPRSTSDDQLEIDLDDDDDDDEIEFSARPFNPPSAVAFRPPRPASPLKLDKSMFATRPLNATKPIASKPVPVKRKATEEIGPLAFLNGKTSMLASGPKRTRRMP